MTHDLLAALPARQGHFVLESGLHTDHWLTLDGLFADPVAVAPMIAALADRIRPHRVSAVVGPLVGGAFLAQALATAMRVDFAYTELVTSSNGPGLFRAEYRLPSDLARRLRGRRVAVVDDVISAGSSVRATVAALAQAEASVAVVGALMLLGDAAVTHFTEHAIAVETLTRREFTLWPPDACPLCRAGQPLENRAG